MSEKKTIEYPIGFADSQLLSYSSNNDNLIVFMKCWNEEIVKFEFIECIGFLILNSWNIADVCEVKDSFLLQRALAKIYEVIPKLSEYRIFQYIDQDGEVSAEIISKNIVISKGCHEK